MKKVKITLLVLACLSVVLMASKCNRDPQGNEIINAPLLQDEEMTPESEMEEENLDEQDGELDSETLDWLEDVTVEEFTEAIDQEMANLAETEKQAILDALVGMSAEELNDTIAKVMEDLDDDEKEKFINWLKEHYLIYQNATIDHWQLPTSFEKPPNMDWATGIPEPGQGSVYKVTQGGDVTQITFANMTRKAYQEWDGSLDEAWAAEQGITEFVDEEKEKLTEYIGLNTEYNFGPNAQTTIELFTEAGRTGEGVLQARVFGNEDMTKWLELAYGQNMATLTYNGDF